MGSDDGLDPIQWATDGDRDLYDIATWEPRTWLDGLSQSLYTTLLASGRVLLIVVAAVIIISQFLITGVVALEDPVIGVYIVLSVVPALLLAVVLWGSDVVVREPLDKLAITFLLGFLFAGFAAPLNAGFQGIFLGFGALGSVLFFYLIVGPVEETVKVLAVRIHAYRSAEFDAVIDGAVYGAMAGLGFAAIENTIYITQNYLQVAGMASGTAATTTVQTAAVRSFAGPGHVIYSAFAGYYLGLAKFNPDNRGPIIVKGLLIAAFIHGTYNVLVSNLGLALGFVPILSGLPPALGFVGFVVAYDGFFFAVLYAKLRRYKRTFEAVGAGDFYRKDLEEPSSEVLHGEE